MHFPSKEGEGIKSSASRTLHESSDLAVVPSLVHPSRLCVGRPPRSQCGRLQYVHTAFAQHGDLCELMQLRLFCGADLELHPFSLNYEHGVCKQSQRTYCGPDMMCRSNDVSAAGKEYYRMVCLHLEGSSTCLVFTLGRRCLRQAKGSTTTYVGQDFQSTPISQVSHSPRDNTQYHGILSCTDQCIVLLIQMNLGLEAFA